jgi:hypothetical protein
MTRTPLLVFACLLMYGALLNSADATVVSFTNSAAFNAAAAVGTVIVEQYATGTNGQTIANGGSFDGLTYNFAAGPLGTLTSGIITNEFNSFSGLSAAGNQSTGQHFFFGGDQVIVEFPAPITAVGMFFNVNLNSGNYDLITPVGNVVTGSIVYDTRTFVFDGITSTIPFSSITLVSENASLGSYNIPEIEFAPVPEPSTLTLLLTALFGLASIALTRKWL